MSRTKFLLNNAYSIITILIIIELTRKLFMLSVTVLICLMKQLEIVKFTSQLTGKIYSG